ncbi:sodium:proton antiporter [Marinicella sp. S1101]|uniref:cation:proton antiporter n=1 Tax=Marinicella marina TaxID=2996016 RepID=UPI002260BFCE|nr:sodium:proton antiporter [Marinicella marina]MCX7552731.1 sodium:proton antiporter [Marinicella marina]MDJ1139960.1 sodium:proton antiporter [Marinicella marina]
MLIQNVVFSLVILIIASLLAEPLARIFRLPFVAFLIIVGFLGSELVVMLGFDTGIRASNFNTMVFYVFLPIIIFESAYRINRLALKENLFVILMLAGPIMLVSAGIAALLIYWGVGHSSGFPIYTALVAGALLVATDPMAVVSHLKRINAPQEVTTLIEGESLFNDAIAVVLFTTLLTLALNQQSASDASFSGWATLLSFLKIFFGGILFGFVCGCLGTFFSYIIKTRILENVLLVSVAYGSFLIAEDTLNVSGMMAVLTAGLIMNKAHEKFIPAEDRVFVNYWWEVISFFANAMIFILLGVTITISMFQERWLAMLIAIAAVLLTRAIAIYGLLPLCAFKLKKPVNEPTKKMLFWGSTRGAVTVALALSLPVELEAWWTIQSMAFGVVLFTLFVQAPTVPRMLQQTHPKHNKSHINLMSRKKD